MTTAAPSQATVEGTVYTADITTGLLVLNISSNTATSIAPSTMAAPTGAYRFIPISQISSFQILNLPTAANASKPTPTPAPTANALDTNALTRRLDRAVTNAQNIQSRKGPKGTSDLDQTLFDALAKTHPARWHGTTMVISEVFMIEKPYEKDNVKILPGASGNVERMKTVLDIEKTKAKLKQPLPVIGGAAENKTKGG